MLSDPVPPAEHEPVVGFQLPRSPGHERVAASLVAHAETAGVDLELQFYDPASFEITQLGPRSQALLKTTDIDNVLWLVPEPQPMRLYLFEGSTQAVWTRRLEGDALDAMAAEVIANVTVSIGLALQAGEVRDMVPVDPAEFQPEPEPEPEPEQEPEPEPEQTPVPEPRPGPAPPAWPTREQAPIWVRLSYVGNTYSDQMPWQSAVAARVTWKIRPRLALWARYAYVATQAIALGEVRADVRRHPITLGFGTRLPLAPRIDVAAGGAFSVDPVTRVLHPNNPQLQQGDDGLRVFTSGIAYAGLGVHAARRVRVGLDLGLDVLLSRADIVVRSGEDSFRHEPDRVRILVAAGVEVALGRAKKD